MTIVVGLLAFSAGAGAAGAPTQVRLRLEAGLALTGARAVATDSHRTGAHGPAATRERKVRLDRDLSVRVLSVRNASGYTPWQGLSCNATNPGTTDTLAVAEPDIAVNPRNPDDQVAAWIDLYRDNIDTAYTTDGGQHWYRAIPMGLNDCSGLSPSNPAIEGAADPGLSFSPQGDVFLSSLEDENGFLPPTSNYTEWTDAQSSSDGGATWSAPVVVRTPPMADDKDMVLADQKRPGYVYVVYRNTGFGLVPGPRGEGQLLFSRSTDGAQTFSTTVLQDTGSTTAAPVDSQLSETRDGTLVYTFNDAAGNLTAMSSTDAGSTWSAPVQVAPPITSPNPTVCGESLATRSDGGHDAVLNGGTVVAARVDNGPNGTGPGNVELSKSSDGGRTWTTSTVLTTARPILEAEIAANPRGQLGLAYYSFDPDHVTCSGTSAVIPATTLVRVSNDAGNTWSDPQVIGAPSWNIASGGVQNFIFAYWIGEYFGMAGTPRGFAAATVQGTPISAGSPTAPVTGLNSIVVGEVLSAN
jgi:hypothetical protein